MFIEKPEGIVAQYLTAIGFAELPTNIEIDDAELGAAVAQAANQHGEHESAEQVLARAIARLTWAKYGVPDERSAPSKLSTGESANLRHMQQFNELLRREVTQNTPAVAAALAHVVQGVENAEAQIFSQGENTRRALDLGFASLPTREQAEDAITAIHLLRKAVCIFGSIIALLLVLLLLVPHAHGQSQISVIKFQGSDGSAIGSVAAPFTFKAGANCTLSKSGPVITFNCTGGVGGPTAWGSITGTLSSQTDLNTALAGKSNTGHTHLTGDITNFPTLATVATSGSYTDLINKPTIPAAQVQTDWNAVSGMGQILNKPTLATVATSGAYADLTGKPTIPTDISGAKYIVQTADANLSAEQALGALGTGILKNTTTTGVLSIATGSDIPNIAESQVTNLTTDLAAKVPTTTTVAGKALSSNITLACADLSDDGTACTKNVPASGNASVTEVVLGNDTRLTDSRTPTAHNLASASHGDVDTAATSGGDIIVRNVGNTQWSHVQMSQDCTMTGAGVITCTKTNNVAFGGGATMSTTAGGDLTGTLPSPTIASGAVTPTKMSTAAKRRTVGCYIGAPNGSALADTDDMPNVYRAPDAFHVTAIRCNSDAGSPTIQVTKNAATNVLSAASLTCTQAWAVSTSFTAGADAFAAGDIVGCTVVAAGGTAKQITIQIDGTVD